MTMQMQVAETPTVEVSEKQKAAWVGLALQKNQLAADLTTKELAAQNLLLSVKESADHKAIDTALESYRKAHTLMVETRRPFTGAIDAAIIQPLMAFEKRVDPKENATYKELEKKSLSLRKEANDAITWTNERNKAIANFKTHCANEFFRTAEIMRTTLRKEIGIQYRLHLSEKATPDIATIKEMLYKIPYAQAQKFIIPTSMKDGQYKEVLTRDEIAAIYSELHKPNTNDVYVEAEKWVDETFANFESDLANAAQAIAHQQQTEQIAIIEDQKAVQEEVAINTLVMTAETPILEEVKIKKTVAIVEEDSEQWLKVILTAFMVNYSNLVKYIKVKSVGKLTVSQMADYLSKYSNETGFRVSNVTYIELEK